MPLDELTNSDMFKGLASIVTGGALVGWFREHRKGRKDAYSFAMDLLSQQNLRIDQLVKDFATLQAQYHVAADALAILEKENTVLRAENDRLKTALGEQGRRAESAQHSLDWHERQGVQE